MVASNGEWAHLISHPMTPAVRARNTYSTRRTPLSSSTNFGQAIYQIDMNDR